MSKWKVCSVPGCERPVSQHNLCEAHWTRLRYYGDVRAEVPIKVNKTKRKRL